MELGIDPGAVGVVDPPEAERSPATKRLHAKALAREIGLPFVLLEPAPNTDGEWHDPVDHAVAHRLGEEVCRNLAVLPFATAGECVTLAVADPSDRAAIRVATLLLGAQSWVMVASQSDIEGAIDRVFTDPEQPAAHSRHPAARARAREKRRLGEILLSHGKVSEGMLEKALDLQEDQGDRLGEILMHSGFVQEIDISAAIAEQQRVTLTDPTAVEPDPEVLALLPESIARRYQVVPLAMVDGTLYLAMADVLDREAIAAVAEHVDCPVRAFVAPPSSVKLVLERIHSHQHQTATATSSLVAPATASPDPLATPFTPDTAPSGLSVRRPWFITPLLLTGFAVTAALMEPAFPRMTYEYGNFIKSCAQDASLLLPKQSSVAIRPLFASLLVLFSMFAAGSLKHRLRLLAMSLGLYLLFTVSVDVVLAWLSQYGGPSPFTAYGNVIAGLVGVLVVAISIFANAVLPGDVRIQRDVPRRWLPVFALAIGGAGTVACVALIEHFAGQELQHLSHLPLLGGSGSMVVMFFVVLPAALCLIGAIVGLLRPRPKTGEWHSVAFIVPARDEEVMIGDCVRAIAAAADAYPGSVQTIVVENGSSDGTAAEVQAAFEEHLSMSSMLIECAPLGKSRALNVALAQADADIVVRIDADTLVAPDLLVKMVPHFWEKLVGGVGVLPVPREQRGWIAHMRAIETYYGAAFKRTAQNVADCVAVLPGATVAYRRSILLQLGGFAEGVNGEDADITVRVGRLGYRIVSDWRIKTYTDVPQNFSQLREQRMRWSRGLYHMVGRNRSAIWMRQGVRGMWMLPWATFMMFRKLMLVPFAVAVVAMILAHPSTLPLREIAAAGAIVIGVQLVQMVVVMLCYGKPSLVAVLPSYLIFRLIVTYYALETLMTLAIGSPKEPSKDEPRATPVMPPETLLVQGTHPTSPIPIK